MRRIFFLIVEKGINEGIANIGRNGCRWLLLQFIYKSCIEEIVRSIDARYFLYLIFMNLRFLTIYTQQFNMKITVKDNEESRSSTQ